MKMKAQIRNRIYLIIPFFHVLISIYFDHNIFIPDNLLSSKIYLIIKAISIITIFVFWCGLFKIVKAALDGNVFWRKFLKHFCIYLGIMLVILLLVWPGIWRNDEAILLFTDINLTFNRWHHWLTDAYYIWALGIIGFPSGIIIVQNILIASMFAFVVTECEMTFKTKKVWLLYIPYLFPSIIDSNLYPLRASVITHLEIFFVMTIYFYFLSKDNIKNYVYIYWSVLIAILATWRSEGIYYVILAPILICILLYKQINIKKIIVMCLVSIMCVCGINSVQKYNNPDQSIYSLSMLIGHLEALVVDENTHITDEEMAVINDVFPKECGTDYLISGFGTVVGDMNIRNDEDFPQKVSELQRLYFKLILRNPSAFIKDCWNLFEKTSLTIHNVDVLCANTVAAFDEGYDQVYATIMSNPYDNYYFAKPLSLELRKKVVSILECRHFDNYSEAYPIHLIFYNVLPNIVILAICIIIGAIKRKKELFFISGFLLVRAGIVFVAAPAWYVMYYFPTILSSYVMLIVFLLNGKNKNDDCLQA